MPRRKIEPSELRAEIGRIIDDRRGQLGLNQAELARRAEIDATSISKMLKGEYTFSDYHLEALANALEVNLSQLLPDGPRPIEASLLEAVRAGEPGAALHALANALGLTGRQLVSAAGFASGSRQQIETTAVSSVGWAAATLAREIAQMVSERPEDAIRLVSYWVRDEGMKTMRVPREQLEPGASDTDEHGGSR